MPSVLGGTKLTPAQILKDASLAGFSGQSLQTISAIAEAESGGYTGAQQWGPWQAGVDRGVVQINSYFHPEVSNQAAYDPVQAFQAAFQISSGGTNFSPWTTFTSGAYKSNIPLFSGLPSGGVQSTPDKVPTPPNGSPSTVPPITQSAKHPSFWLVLVGSAITLIGIIVVLSPGIQRTASAAATAAKVAAV